ncbi:hypothetical protein EVAR_37183_1 [Eumeta japonica]|uniref:Uncharacterized protein n=1 Tax=Eumeta variegata TaxID=151549 RepID=A0A4C1WLM6_EUMVA|nr:hypothetical protein EVAR_37183_1 [Eumeta japonica]
MGREAESKAGTGAEKENGFRGKTECEIEIEIRNMDSNQEQYRDKYQSYKESMRSLPSRVIEWAQRPGRGRDTPLSMAKGQSFNERFRADKPRLNGLFMAGRKASPVYPPPPTAVGVQAALQFIACISFQRVDNDRSKTFKHGITAPGSRYYNIMNGFPAPVGPRAAGPIKPLRDCKL